MRKTAVLFLLSTAYLLGFDIDVEITNVKPSCNLLKIGLYNSKENFPLVHKAYKAANIETAAKNIKYKFDNIPAGTYAIALFCDENKNGKLDTDFFGVPKEAYGFSNNPNVFGKPSFADSSFALEQNKKLKIEVK